MARPLLPRLLALAVAAASAAALAQTSDLDALELKAEPAKEPAAPRSPTKAFVEASIGKAWQRYDLGDEGIGRLSFDGLTTQRLGDAWQATLSARLDATHPKETRYDGAVFSLREVYLGWQGDGGRNAVDVGRVNVRTGPAYGYNPTDFFRDRALRTITTANPFTLRENRLGVFMLRGQRLWDGGSASLALAPEIADKPATEGMAIDAGSTNDRNRALATLATTWSEAVSSQLLLYGEANRSAVFGANATALLSSALVAHAEFTTGREPSLLAKAGIVPDDTAHRNRVVVGATYTTSFKLSLTAEAEYNGAAIDHAGWQQLQATNPAALPAYYTTAVEQQDIASRRAIFVYATQRDLFTKNLELTALMRFNRVDSSRLGWIDLRYRMERLDVALQVLTTAGRDRSEFGILPVRDTVSVLAAYYF